MLEVQDMLTLENTLDKTIRMFNRMPSSRSIKEDRRILQKPN